MFYYYYYGPACSCGCMINFKSKIASAKTRCIKCNRSFYANSGIYIDDCIDFLIKLYRG